MQKKPKQKQDSPLEHHWPTTVQIAGAGFGAGWAVSLGVVQ